MAAACPRTRPAPRAHGFRVEGVAERPGRRVSGRGRPLGARLRGVRRWSRGEHPGPRAGRRCSQAVPRAPGHPGLDVSDPRCLAQRRDGLRLAHGFPPARVGSRDRCAPRGRRALPAALDRLAVGLPQAHGRRRARRHCARGRVRARHLGGTSRSLALGEAGAGSRDPSNSTRLRAPASCSGRRSTGRFASPQWACSSRLSDFPSVTAENVGLVQVSQSLSTLLPLAPAGIGTEQGLLVYVLQGEGSTGAILSFSVGMRMAVAAVNVAVAAAVLLVVLRTVRWQRVLANAPNDPSAEPWYVRPAAVARDRPRGTHCRRRPECPEHQHQRGEPDERVHECDARLHADGERDRLAQRDGTVERVRDEHLLCPAPARYGDGGRDSSRDEHEHGGRRRRRIPNAASTSITTPIRHAHAPSWTSATPRR